MSKCPLCDGDLPHPVAEEPSCVRVSCPRCGDFVLWVGPFRAFWNKTIPDPHILSGYTREQTERDNRWVDVRLSELGTIRNQGPQSVQEKADRLLNTLARKSPSPGYEVVLHGHNDYPLGYCANDAELTFFIQHLRDAGLISQRGTNQGRYCTVTPAGWSRVESLKKSNRESLKVFVAMAFRDDMKPAFTDGIKPAVEACGYRPLRIDSKEYLGGILDEIIAEIRESRFVVADLTLQRQGAYYEAGFALGLGLPVVLTCQEDDLKNVHFDAQHMNILVWKTPAELVTLLKNRIRAVIGLAPGTKV